MRAAIARRMQESKQTAPHFYVAVEIEVDRLLDLIADLNRDDGEPRVTVTSGLVVALGQTLLAHPHFNAHFTSRGHEIFDRVNLGVAIPVDDGLVAPALLDCGQSTIKNVAARLADLIDRVRRGRLHDGELTGATFTLSNLGGSDVTAFAAIIPPPQVAILATGRAQTRAFFVGDELVSRRVMTATLSADHRAVDGQAAARFLEHLKRVLEDPNEMVE